MSNQSIQAIRSELGEYAIDIKLNLGSVLSEEGAPELKQNQIMGIALSCAYATKNNELIEAVKTSAQEILSEQEIFASKAAATIMAMNNIYYRATHLATDKELIKLPANLRMNIMGKPGIDKVDFELYTLAVSVINGCGMCIDAHIHQLTKAGLSKLAIQSSLRIAAVINATAQALVIG